MLKRLWITILLAGLMALAGCDALDTGDTNQDAEAAQNFFPTIAGYNVQQTDDIQNAIVVALGGASMLQGNPVQAALIERLDTLIDCYRERGALDARVYIENVTNLQSLDIPTAGALLVVNRSRIADNFASCLFQGPSAQGVAPEPCANSGTFEYAGDTISYYYAATDQLLCDAFQAHFNTYGGTG